MTNPNDTETGTTVFPVTSAEDHPSALRSRIDRIERALWGSGNLAMPEHLKQWPPSASRGSSPELSTLAAKYLGMSLEEMDASILEREPSDGDRLEQDLERVLSRTAYADIKRLAASVLSQST